MQSGIKDMFEVYLESVPFHLTTPAIAFGEVFYLEAFMRRINLCQCAKTRRVYEKFGILYAAWNISGDRAGDFRQQNLLTSD
jgi:hypothetical protein